MVQRVFRSKALSKGILLAVGVLSVLTLCLPLQIVTATVDYRHCVYYDSGFTFFRFSSFFVDSYYTPWLNIFLGCLFIAQFLSAVLTIAFAVTSYFKTIKNDNKIGFYLFILCSVFMVLYFLTGIILYIIYTDMGTETLNGHYTEFFIDNAGRIRGENISIQTCSYIPLLIEIIGIAALYLYEKVAP